jgi:intraflagellar transport protein 46
MPGDADSFSGDSSLDNSFKRGDDIQADNDFAFAESYDSGGQRGAPGEVHTDKPYDEAIEVQESDENVSTPDSTPKQSKAPAKQPDTPNASRFPNTSPMASSGTVANQQIVAQQSDSESDSTSEESGEGGGDGQQAKPTPGQYDPAEFQNLDVPAEVNELFQYITRYKPHTVDLETKLKPFIPDFIPAVGEVDGFIKVPRPDGKESSLGLTKLDEPCLNPSDPTVLDLQLRSISKHSNMQPMEVRAIENAERNPKEIANWISRIADLHRMKPPPNVQYGKKMPDIEKLMQVWPTEFEDYITSNPLPIAEIDMPLQDFVKMIAVLLDVPVHSDNTDTLHVIFTLYSEFKNNPHFSPGLPGEPTYDVNGVQMQPVGVTPVHSEHGSA